MKDDDLIERYHPADRANHWLTAITFILLAASGLALFHPAFFFLSHLFGGGPWRGGGGAGARGGGDALGGRGGCEGGRGGGGGGRLLGKGNDPRHDAWRGATRLGEASSSRLVSRGEQGREMTKINVIQPG